jgi:hypothetical protein
MFEVSPTMSFMYVSAFVTDGSVHLILWAVRSLYFAGP